MNNKYEIIKLLNKGGFGHIYLIKNKLNNKKYALKKIHLFKKDINPKTGLYYKIVEMFNKLNSINKIHFLKLYDNYIIDNCEEFEPDSNTEYNKNFNYNIFKTPYCGLFIMSLVDMNLHEFIINKNIYTITILNNLLIQLLYITYLLNINNLLYIDLKPENIGLKKTKKKTITFNNIFIPIELCGYYVVLLDYDNVFYKNTDIDIDISQNNYLKILIVFHQ